MRKIKQLSIILTLLFGVLFLFQNCQKEEIIIDQMINPKAKKITLSDLKNNSRLSKTLKRIENRFDINQDKSIDINSILTDEIIEVITSDSTATYSFKLEYPTDSTSTFENFIIKFSEPDNLSFYLFKYKYNSESEEDFYYTVSVQNISNDDIDDGYFLDMLDKFMVWDGNCLMEITWDYDCQCEYATVIICNDGGGSSNGDSNGSSSGSDGSDSGNSGDSGDDGGSSNTGGAGSNGSGSSSSNSSNDVNHRDLVAGINMANANANDVEDCVGSGSLNSSQTNWLYDDANQDAVGNILIFLNSNGCSSENSSTVSTAINLIINGVELNLTDLFNNIISISEGLDDDSFDSEYWSDPDLSFPEQDLPIFEDFDSAYPKASDGGKMPGTEVFELIGGIVLSTTQAAGTGNACAARVSRALNYSGVIIPNISGKTFKGSDDKYYFLGARKLYEWMKLTFGEANFSLTGSSAGTDGTGFVDETDGASGIYIMIPNYPASFGATGHADIFDGTGFNGSGFFNANGGVYSANLWTLD